MTLQDLINDANKRGIPLDKPIQFSASASMIQGVISRDVDRDEDCYNDVIFECELGPGWGTRHVEARLVPVECR